MNKQTSVKKNFIMNALLTMSSFIFPLITFPYISTVLSPSGYGTVSFATSLIVYFTMFSQLGIPTYGIRACAQVRDHKDALSKTVHELFLINFVMMIFSYIVFAIVLLLVPKVANEKPLFLIMSLSMFFNCIGMEWLYKGLEQYSYITMRSIFFKFLALVLMLTLVHTKSDYVLYGALAVLASSASYVLNLIHARHFIYFKKYSNYDFKKHLKPIGVFFAMSCATTVYTNLDTVMLGFMKTDTDVGYYQAAVRVKSLLVSVVTSLGTVLLPRASYYIENKDYDSFNYITSKALNFVLLVSLPMCIYFMIFAPQGIYFLSSSEYTGSIIPMQVIMPTLLFIGLTNILGLQILVPTGNEKYVLYSEIAGAAVDLIINIILIPKLASTGAAIGTVVAECVVLIVQYHYCRDIVKDMFKKYHYGSIGAAIVLASVCSFSIRNMTFVESIRWNSFMIMAISSIIFFGVYFLFLLIRKESLIIDLKKQVFSKLRRS